MCGVVIWSDSIVELLTAWEVLVLLAWALLVLELHVVQLKICILLLSVKGIKNYPLLEERRPIPVPPHNSKLG